MGINLAGVDLVLEDPDGKMRDFLDQWIPFEDQRHTAEFPSALWNQPNGLTVPNWAQKMRPKLNTWYYPSGASRWGFGLFLCSGAMKTQIVSTVGSAGGGSAPTTALLINDPINKFNRTFACYILPPHPVSSNSDDPNSLWIIPVVDQRYFWQHSRFDSFKTILTTGTTPTWASVFTNISVGPKNDPGVPSAYALPYQWDLNRLQYQNAAVVFDVLAFSTGLRLAEQGIGGNGNFIGTTAQGWALQSYSAANSQRNNFFAGGASSAIGSLQVGVLGSGPGGVQAINPFRIDVVFRSFKNGIILPETLTDAFTIGVTAAQAGFGFSTNLNYIKTIRSKALANFNSGGGNPDNLTGLNNLATQIATDFYGWNSWFQDQTFLSVCNVPLTGFEDYIEFSFELDKDLGEYLPRTHVHTMPHNTYVDDLLQWENTASNWTGPDTVVRTSRPWEWGNLVIGTLDANISAFGNMSIAVTSADVLFISGEHIIVTEGTGQTYTSGTTVGAIRKGNNWVIIGSAGSGGNLLIGTPASNTLHGNSVTFNLSPSGTQSAFVRRGCVLTTGTYLLAPTSSGFECANPELALQCQFSTTTVANATGTATLYAGTAGAETSTSLTDSVFIRNGFVFASKTYEVRWDETGWKVFPDIWALVKNLTGSDISKGSTGTCTIMTGTQGSETSSGVTVTALARYGVFKNNAIGRVIVDNTGNTPTCSIESTDTC